MKLEPIKKGKSYSFVCDVVHNGVFIDVSGDDVICYVDKQYNQTTPAIEIIGVNDDTFNYRKVFTFDPDKTNIEAGTHHLEIEWTDPDGNIWPIKEETIEVLRAVKSPTITP